MSLILKTIKLLSNHIIKVSHLAEVNVPEQQLIKITERSNSISVKPDLNLQQN